MAKAVKLRNDLYLDTRGIVHNKEILKPYLDNLKSGTDNLQNQTNNLQTQLTNLSNSLGEYEVIWFSYFYMNANQTVNIPKGISSYRNGIILVFCAYSSGKPQDYNFSYCFVHKYSVIAFNSRGVWFPMGGSEKGIGNSKYIYVHNTKLVGHKSNDSDGYVLRAVIGF